MTSRFSIRLPDGRHRTIGGTAPCFVIAEIGTNWHAGDSGDDSQARRLIDVAAGGGCDAVKFQTYSPETVYAPKAGASAYLREAGITRSIHDVIAERVMPREMIPELAAYAAAQNVVFMSSCFSLDDVALINPLTPIHKLASYEISHLRLIDALAATRKPLVMSTGASETDDIAWAVRRFRAKGGKNLVLMQCTASYPAPDDAMNLSVLSWLAKRFDCIPGLSDHSRHPLWAPVASVALGAKVIEKHITLNRKAAGPDHFNSVEPDEFAQMLEGIRAAEVMRGDGIKRVLTVEKELWRFARRRVQATRKIKPGDKLVEGENIAILRPGNGSPGAHPRDLPRIQGKNARRAIDAGDGVTADDVRPRNSRKKQTRKSGKKLL